MANNSRVPSSFSQNPNSKPSLNNPMRHVTLLGSSSVEVRAKRERTDSQTTATTNINNNDNLMMMPPPSRQEQRQDLTIPSSKKPRGRPPGSKNKPKPPVYIEENTCTFMGMINIEIPVGIDIVKALINIARHRQASIRVLGGSGIVSNVILVHPLSGAATFPTKERFQMIGLSGAYINADCDRVPPRFIIDPICSSFSIYLSGAGGKLFGGVVGRDIYAAGVVSVTAILFRNPKFYRAFGIYGSMHEIKLED